MQLDDAINAATGLAALAGVAVGLVVGNKFTLKQVRDGDHDGYVYNGPTDIEAELAKAEENTRFIATQIGQLETRLGADVAFEEAIVWVGAAEKDIEVLGRAVDEALGALQRARRVATNTKVNPHAKRNRERDAAQVPHLDDAIAKMEAFRDQGLPMLAQACTDRRGTLGDIADS